MSEETKIVDSEREGRIYEVGFLIDPAIAEESLMNEVIAIKDLVTGAGGAFISDEYPKLIDLAYEMEKTINNKKQFYNRAYFGWVKFDAEPGAMEGLKAALMLKHSIIRFLLIKTVRENTISLKKSFVPRRKYTLKRTEEVAVPINKEEVDAQIDAMVAEEEEKKA